MSIHRIIPEVFLASKSKPRRELLEKLHFKFNVLPADIDETPNLNEAPIELVERLSRKKGQEILNRLQKTKPDHDFIIISSDQIAVVNNKIYGKPGTHEKAVDQLKAFSGQNLEFITGLCVMFPENYSGPNKGEKHGCSINPHISLTSNGLHPRSLTAGFKKKIDKKKFDSLYTYEKSTLKIKDLTDNQIQNYLIKEKPYNCAASFKIEGLGISLVENLQTEDFNAIIGLPLIKLTSILSKINLDVLSI